MGNIYTSYDKNSATEITTDSFVDSVDIDWDTPTTSDVSPVFQERTRLKPVYTENLGISYSSPTFTINAADGSALSLTNPGYVCLASKANPGQAVLYQITANQSFDDASGTSDITGNRFGFTTAIGTGTSDVPFFIYAVGNNDEDTIQFMISRVPSVAFSPPAGDIGAPDDAVADQQNDFWSFDNIDETLYDNNPCCEIGGFRMRLDASDDWTVQAITNSNGRGPLDGIGLYFIGQPFEIPLGQFGANSGTLTIPNGGTAPVFSNNFEYSYTFIGYKSPFVHITIWINGDGGTNGSGAVDARIASPFVFSTQENQGRMTTVGRVQTPATAETAIFKHSGSTNFFDFALSSSALTLVDWSAFTNGSRQIEFTGTFRIRLDL